MTEKEKGAEPSSFLHRGVTYIIGDVVCLQPPKKDAPPFIGRIETVGAATPSGKQIRVAWYYRPEEAAGGRKAFHSANELFSSDHFDWVDIASVLYKCKIHTLSAFQSLASPDVANLNTQTDFFVRFAYKAKTGQFKPDRIPVYCVCEMPYNPDLHMVECRWCLEWYHPECVGLDRAAAGSDFVCHECGDVRDKGVGGGGGKAEQKGGGKEEGGSGGPATTTGGGPPQKKGRMI